MATKRILTIIGTRPNFIKVTQFRKAAALHKNIELEIIHTGQHFDGKMADVFFEQFGLTPDHFLNVPPGSPNSQIAEIMLRLEKIIMDKKPDMMLVVGDVNSTLAASVTANKTGVKLAHIESGLRSNDRTMPEEFNRLVTDELSDLLFVTEQSGLDNLAREGKNPSSIHFVGNTMIDTMVAFSSQIDASPVISEMKLREKGFVLMTMHRPATVDTKEGLEKLLALLEEVTQQYDVVFPVHPRTVNHLKKFGLHERLESNSRIKLTEPLDYFAFQKLIKCCKFILTDSGGIQEESTFLQVPCLTLRPNTERPVTVTLGSNELLPFDIQTIRGKIKEIESGNFKKGAIPPLWDGKATERIFEILSRTL
jgi:UDP-N-acetylglucosamine 2-epimerase (non-hydrolysing)